MRNRLTSGGVDRVRIRGNAMMTGLSTVRSNYQRHRPRKTIQFLRGLLVVLLLILPATAAKAIDVVEHRWGFNGKVAAHRFNLLNVLINNPTPQTFTGEVALKKTLGGAGSVDATIVELVTISPNSQKWVQFYPYISSDNNYTGSISDVWRISYRGGSFDLLPSPKVAKYQRVILDDPNSVQAKSSTTVKFHFQDNLFPPFVSATDALQLVVLDHIPRWEESRRQSFLDWVYLGGTVIILQDPAESSPISRAP